jgi:hypothetical protein
MGLLKLLNTGKSLVGLKDKLITKVPLGEVVPNFNTRPGAMSRMTSAVRGRRRGGDSFADEARPSARAGGPKIRSTVAPDPTLPKNPFARPVTRRRQPKTDEALLVREQASLVPRSESAFVPPSAAKSWATRLRLVRDSVRQPVTRKLKVPARLVKVFGEQAAAVRRRVPRGPLAARRQLAAA